MFKNKVILLLLLSLMVMPHVSATTGFGPAEIITSNQVGTMVIGNATLINGDDTPKYGVFEIVMPYSDRNTFTIIPSEINHARVICKDCHNEMQRYEAIPGYKYGDPLEGTCTKCGGHNLIFYDIMPRDEYEMLSIEASGNFHLKKIAHHTWRTEEMISPHGACNINILYDASNSYILENFDKHWEVHLRGKTTTNEKEFMTGGIDLRVLISFKFPLHIQVLDTIEKGKPFRVKITYGPPSKSWSKIPNNVKVTFNGETKTINNEGLASFIMPSTRFNYKYDIIAMGDEYLTGKITVSYGTGNTGFSFFSIPIHYLIITIAVIVIIIILILFLSRRRKWY